MGTQRPTAWVLNLDADLELAAGSGYSPTNAVRGAMAKHVERLAASLLGPDDIRVDEASAPESAKGYEGRAFCPTPRAIALLVRAGASPVAHPPVSVLREVNGRAFCAALGPTLPDGAFVHDLAAAEALVARTPAVGRQWRAKRAFGMSGRGQRRIAPGAITDADRAFFRSAIDSDHGVMIEPDVPIVRELAIHGELEANGVLQLGQLVEQRCDVHGQWLETTPASTPDDTRAALEDEARRVASALFAAGYFGPFGIDAFEYRDLEDVVRLQPRSEINARYSMGFAVGFVRGR
jgi:hypothetical protein